MYELKASKQGGNQRFSGASAMFGGILVIGLVSILALPNRAEFRKMSKDNRAVGDVKKEKKAKTPIVSASDTASADTGSRRSLDFYAKGVRSSLFSAPQPPPPAKPKPIPVQPAPKPKPIYIPPVVPVEINPFADWSYTGTVTMGETKMALVENTKTKEGQYLKQGENFLGAQVSQVTDQMVSFMAGSKPYLLAKSDNVNVVQLDRSAPYLNGGQPGAPGQPQPGGAPPTGAQPGAPPPPDTSGAKVVLPNGAVLSGRNAIRYNNRMNRKFK